MKAAIIFSIVTLVGGCASTHRSNVAIYYREPSSCEFLGLIHEESKHSYEEALDNLRKHAEQQGANLVRVDAPPNAETFTGGSTATNWVITYYAEAKAYHCNWAS
jgi:hypothetical protein